MKYSGILLEASITINIIGIIITVKDISKLK